MTTALPQIAAKDVASIASSLTITDFVTGTRVPWVPTRIQRRCWDFSEENQRGMIGKPRRAMVTTACDLDDVLQTVVADAAGHRIRTGIMLDVEDKVTERMWQCADFLTQLGLEHRATDYYIELPGKSEIVGLTAGGRRAAASTGFQRMRYSEACYYADEESIPAASAAVGKHGHEMIESTIDIGASNGRQMRRMWDDPNSGFEPLFIPFEWHLDYRMHADAITDAEWEQMQAAGFTIREAAAYWLREIVPNKCAGDTVRAKHEYPQTPEDMFASSDLLWVRKRSRTLEPLEVWRVPSIVGADVWPVFVWRKPEQTSGRICITCDSAKGSGVSRATAVAIDEEDGRAVATFADPLIMGDDHARVAWEVYQRYSREIATPTGSNEMRRPRVLVEDNSMGQVLIQPLRRIGIPFETFDTDEGMKLLGMQLTKAAIESGRYEGPKELAEECDECSRDPVTGKFKGRKDLMMSYGFWAARTTAPVHGVKRDTRTEHRIDGRKLILAQMRRERHGWH